MLGKKNKEIEEEEIKKKADDYIDNMETERTGKEEVNQQTDEYEKQVEKIISDLEKQIDDLKEKNVELKVRFYILSQILRDFETKK